MNFENRYNFIYHFQIVKNEHKKYKTNFFYTFATNKYFDTVIKKIKHNHQILINKWQKLILAE